MNLVSIRIEKCTALPVRSIAGGVSEGGKE